MQLSPNQLIKKNSYINYTYYTNPTMKKIVPLFGKITGNTNVDIHGVNFQNFSGYLQCSFGMKFVPAFFVNKNKIICM